MPSTAQQPGRRTHECLLLSNAVESGRLGVCALSTRTRRPRRATATATRREWRPPPLVFLACPWGAAFRPGDLPAARTGAGLASGAPERRGRKASSLTPGRARLAIPFPARAAAVCDPPNLTPLCPRTPQARARKHLQGTHPTMGKVPVRLREVVYTLSPFQQTVMAGLWKDAPAKLARKFSEVRVLFFFSSRKDPNPRAPAPPHPHPLSPFPTTHAHTHTHEHKTTELV